MDKVILTQVSLEWLTSHITNDVVKNIKELLANQKEQTTQEKEYLTRKEVSALFKVSLVSISAWQKKGILKPYRIGSRIRFRKDEVLAALSAIEAKRG